MPPSVRSVHKIEGQSQKQSDRVVGWDISWHQYPAQKRPQRYGWARKMGGFCRKVLAPPVRLWKLRESVRKPVPKWCAKAGYRFNAEKAAAIYSHAGSQVDTLPMSSAIQSLITHAVAQLNMIIETISAIQHEMLTLASQLPEYPIVMRMFGVGPVLGPQLMAEIGDVRRFHRKQSLVAFAGVDAPPASPVLLNRRIDIFPNADPPDCAKRFSKSCPLSSNMHPLMILYTNFLTVKGGRASTTMFT